MAIAKVAIGGAVTSTTGVAPSFGQPTTAGNLLVAWHACDAGVANQISGAGWVQAVTQTVLGGRRASIYCRPNCGAGEAPPTFSGSTLYAAARLIEFSGTANSLDRSGSVGDSSHTTIVPTARAADLESGDVALYAFINQQNPNSATTFSHVLSANQGGLQDEISDASSVLQFHFDFGWAMVNANSIFDSDSFTDNGGNFFAQAGVVASFGALLPPRASRASWARRTRSWGRC